MVLVHNHYNTKENILPKEVIVNQENHLLEENYQFIHLIYKDGDKSSFYSYVEPFITKLEVKDLFRIKANLNPKTLNHKYGGYHFDPYRKGKIGVYYVNDNNGGTQFKKGGKVNSVANRMVIFDANLEHTSVTCTDKKRRIVINFNYA